MAQRSKHYDWFQGQKHKKSPKDNFKANAKTTWRFAKIFLYFSLFFFSMWGCVQVFTHKIDTRPAAGITFSNGDDNLSPQVSQFTLVDGEKEIYFQDSSISYMSPKNALQKKVIVNVNKQLKNDFDIDSPTRARKGGNYVIEIRDQTGKSIDRNNEIVISNKKLEKNKVLLYTTAPINKLKDDYNLDASFNVLRSLAPNGIRHHSYKIEKRKDDDKQKIVKVSSSYFINIEALAVRYKELKAKGKLSANQELAFYFNAKLFEAIYNKLNSKRAIKLNSRSYLRDAIVPENEQVEFLRQNQNVKFFLDLIFVKGTAKRALEARALNYPVGFSAKTNWVPITTWGKAWDKDGGTGPFYGIFVFPIAVITNAILNTIPNLEGWESLITIIIIVVTLSVIMFALNFKNTLQQTKIQELSAKKAVIDAKYAPYKGNKQMENRQRQEVASLYKKEGISPLAQIGSLFLRMPFFLAMWRVIGSIDHIKTTEWIGINFATTSWRALLGNLTQWNNGWSYFPLILTAVGSQLFSTLLPKILTKRRNKDRMNVQQKEAMKKSDRTQKILMIVTLFFPLITSAGVQVYFIIRSVWTIFEQIITHKLIVKRKKMQIARATT